MSKRISLTKNILFSLSAILVITGCDPGPSMITTQTPYGTSTTFVSHNAKGETKIETYTDTSKKSDGRTTTDIVRLPSCNPGILDLIGCVLSDKPRQKPDYEIARDQEHERYLAGVEAERLALEEQKKLEARAAELSKNIITVKKPDNTKQNILMKVNGKTLEFYNNKEQTIKRIYVKYYDNGKQLGYFKLENIPAGSMKVVNIDLSAIYNLTTDISTLILE